MGSDELHRPALVAGTRHGSHRAARTKDPRKRPVQDTASQSCMVVPLSAAMALG